MLTQSLLSDAVRSHCLIPVCLCQVAMLFSPLVFCKVDHPKFFALLPNYLMHRQDDIEFEFHMLGPINTPGWTTETPHESKKHNYQPFQNKPATARVLPPVTYIAGYSGYSNQLE